MNAPQLIVLALIVVLALIWTVRFERLRRAALAQYWSRRCAGREWRRSFPHSPKGEIREFLYMVVDAFGFDRRQALKLAPTDSLLSLYRAAYPDRSAPDALEIETLHRSLAKAFGSEAFESVGESVTFGELFARAGGWRPNKSLERGREG